MDHKDIVLPGIDVSGQASGSRFSTCLAVDWHQRVAEYEASPGSFYTSWHYLDNHPLYWYFGQSLGGATYPPTHYVRLVHNWGVQRGVDLSVARVNPATGNLDEDDTLNTDVRVWAETGEVHLRNRDERWHDYTIDTDGATVEEVIIRLARKVWDKYGNDRRHCETQ